MHESAKDLSGYANVVFEKCDVTKWADLANLIKVSKEKFGDVPDVYVANAGVFEPVCGYTNERNKELVLRMCISSPGRVSGKTPRRIGIRS